MPRCFLQVAKSGDHSLLQIGLFGNQRTSHTVVLHVIPDQLARVKLIGRVRLQVEQPELFSPYLNISSDDPGPMYRMSIRDQKDRAAALDKPLEKADENQSAQPAAHRHGPKIAPPTDRHTYVEIEALASDPHNQRLAAGRLDRNQDRIQDKVVRTAKGWIIACHHVRFDQTCELDF